MASTKPDPIYQLKVTLEGAKPPIWRRILVDSGTLLPDLHIVLQTAMGWENYHLHQFIVNGQRYAPPDCDALNEAKYRLNQLLKAEKDKLVYEYDFGDGWHHKVVLEKILPLSDDMQIPSCIKGKGACPPEDVGGIWGFYDYLAAISDKNHPEHEAMLEWGGEYDPDELDLDDINEDLDGCIE